MLKRQKLFSYQKIGQWLGYRDCSDDKKRSRIVPKRWHALSTFNQQLSIHLKRYPSIYWLDCKTNRLAQQFSYISYKVFPCFFIKKGILWPEQNNDYDRIRTNCPISGIGLKKNHKPYLFIGQVEDEEERDQMMESFIEALHRYCEHLFFEMGGHQDAENVELIITANGDPDFFSKVELLVNHAPKVPGWTFIKFKQAQGSNFATNYQGRIYDPQKTIFIPLHSEEEPQGVGIRVCYSDYDEEEREHFLYGTYLMLDVLLGEKSTSMDIDYLDVIETPKDIDRYEFLHLEALPEFIKAKKEP